MPKLLADVPLRAGYDRPLAKGEAAPPARVVEAPGPGKIWNPVLDKADPSRVAMQVKDALATRPIVTITNYFTVSSNRDPSRIALDIVVSDACCSACGRPVVECDVKISAAPRWPSDARLLDWSKIPTAEHDALAACRGAQRARLGGAPPPLGWPGEDVRPRVVNVPVKVDVDVEVNLLPSSPEVWARCGRVTMTNPSGEMLAWKPACQACGRTVHEAGLYGCPASLLFTRDPDRLPPIPESAYAPDAKPLAEWPQISLEDLRKAADAVKDLGNAHLSPKRPRDFDDDYG